MTAENSPLEHQEPGLLERAKRLVGLGTFDIVNMEDKTQTEQRMAYALHTRGGQAFRILRSVEMTQKTYARDQGTE